MSEARTAGVDKYAPDQGTKSAGTSRWGLVYSFTSDRHVVILANSG